MKLHVANILLLLHSLVSYSLAEGKNAPLPYVTAFSAITNPNTNQLESFSLNCPHVTDASKDEVQIEVTWTLNDAIWLKIVDGVRRIDNKLTTHNKKAIAGKNVLRISENFGRYWFDYDELTGDFSMEIRPVIVEEDAGVWQCHVTVFQEGNTHTLTSRRRVKPQHRHRSHASYHQQHYQSGINHHSQRASPASSSLEASNGQSPAHTKLNIFSRTNSELVHISREPSNNSNMVVFDRRAQQAQFRSHNRHQNNQRDTVIDYELNMNHDSFGLKTTKS
ncbi:unnamed protein product, partial [Mesorhabditis belari]|uniref:Ig-like domain-containing protein n=1 Tax=Mesorhabditis belari TaxID=2138241 RepID=A0AAF3F202_9BILA